MKLTAKQLKQIEERIALAEKKTSGEIVVTVVPQSGGYAWIWYAWGTLGAVTTTVVITVLSLTSWGFSALQMVEWQILGTCVGLLLALIPACRRLFVSKKVRASKVHRESLAAFVARGIVETRDRTGILIYVSHFEHRVEILADKGIHLKVGEDYWKQQTAEIVDGIHKGQMTEALCHAVDEMGSRLAAFFPPRPGDTNELPDKVQ